MPTGIYDRQAPEDRFWANVNKTDTCWLWFGNKNSDGYGRIGIDYKRILAHRYSYEFHYGDIPEGLQVNHHCDTPACVNLGHLYVGTNQDNMDDYVNRGWSRKGEKHHNAKLTREDVLIIRALSGHETQKKVAGWFNIAQGHVNRIVNNKTWDHL